MKETRPALLKTDLVDIYTLSAIDGSVGGCIRVPGRNGGTYFLFEIKLFLRVFNT